MVDRSNKVDVFRGLLFALMVNSHALTLAHVPGGTWFYSDWWLPKGWATVVFVILSGYGVGVVYSNRPAAAHQARLHARCAQLLGVMFASNTLFAVLREAAAGNFAVLSTLHWWLGFFTLETAWTISGVLLPTALVMLCGAALIRWSKGSPWMTLAALLVVRALVSAATVQLAGSAHAEDWLVRFLFTRGFGGYPVLPFVINGCIGIWLGVMRRQREQVWKAAMACLLALQLMFYVAFTVAPDALTTQLLITVSPLGKFACLFVVTHLFERFGPEVLVAAIETIGRFALGSFVMHRILIQLLAVVASFFLLGSGTFQLRYAFLAMGTLLLTWGVCRLRDEREEIDGPFRRLAL
jgi:hypothetical protein